jgi:hypothetical protein
VEKYRKFVARDASDPFPYDAVREQACPYDDPPSINSRQFSNIASRTYRYPKHVWSPAGGWYAQPGNWRANTLVAAGVMVGIVAITWKFSAERETWARKPEPGEWHPSR